MLGFKCPMYLSCQLPHRHQLTVSPEHLLSECLCYSPLTTHAAACAQGGYNVPSNIAAILGVPLENEQEEEDADHSGGADAYAQLLAGRAAPLPRDAGWVSQVSHARDIAWPLLIGTPQNSCR